MDHFCTLKRLVAIVAGGVDLEELFFRFVQLIDVGLQQAAVDTA